MKLILTFLISFVIIPNLQAQHDSSVLFSKDHNVSLHLYPLPAKAYVNIYVTAEKPAYVTISIYDDNYQAQSNDVKAMVSKDYQKGIDVTKLPNGIYHVNVVYKGDTLQKYFTVAH